MMKHRFALLLLGFGLLFILLAWGIAAYQRRIGIITPAPLPREIAGHRLTREILGAPALYELSWLHGQEFQLNQGAVGSYGIADEIKLYVAGTPLSFMAGRLVTAMKYKIAQLHTPFTPLAEREYDQRTVYELVGMGQQHFYFRSGNLVIWLAVNGQEANLALEQVLMFYP